MTGPDLVVRRVLPASPHRVFAAWTDSNLLNRWMSPSGSAFTSLDLRVGGVFRIVMKGTEAGLPFEIEHTGQYLEIDPPRRLVFSWRSPYTNGDSRVTVTLVPAGPEGAHTELTLVHQQLPTYQTLSHEGGWGRILSHLESLLKGD